MTRPIYYGFDCLFFACVSLNWLLCSVSGLGCIPQLCDENPGNEIASANCLVYKDHCGAYGGKRFDNSLFRGVDVKCDPNKTVLAPFNGTLTYYRPRGGQNGSQCIDQGIKVQGTGKWSGYTAVISYIRPLMFSGEIKQGDPLGVALDLTCASSLTGQQKPHFLFQLLFQGRPVDPTYRLSECLCTGQICSSNSINEFVGMPFKHKTNFGKGYELNCPDTKENENSPDIVPTIYSPIEASFLGRFRPWNATNDGIFKCDNDGVFLIGAGKWKKFVVHIYNVKFSLDPGPQVIEQGKQIAKRLVCPDHKDADSEVKTIFLEFRYNGKLVNATNLISASDCKLPKFPQ
uniref:Peptidase M23 domain-containing protein n=1 Tax=Romanomermis culicivorax TaxID=13658 RepID=A0A915HUY1_ROMCU